MNDIIFITLCFCVYIFESKKNKIASLLRGIIYSITALVLIIYVATLIILSFVYLYLKTKEYPQNKFENDENNWITIEILITILFSSIIGRLLITNIRREKEYYSLLK